jgi:hypothetical protein
MSVIHIYFLCAFKADVSIYFRVVFKVYSCFMKLLELFFFLVVSEETCQYLYVPYSLFNVMYLFVSSVQYRDILSYLQFTESNHDNAV